MNIWRFSVILEPDAGGYRAWCPALRDFGAEAQGATEDEAFLNLHDSVQTIVDGLHRDGKPVPEPTDELFLGVRATITVIPVDDSCTAEDLMRFGVPIPKPRPQPPKVKPKARAMRG